MAVEQWDGSPESSWADVLAWAKNSEAHATRCESDRAMVRGRLKPRLETSP